MNAAGVRVRDLELTPQQVRNIPTLGRRVIPREEFLEDVRAATAAGRGYAAGRIGMSQKHWMFYPILKSRNAGNPKIYKVFEQRLKFHGLQQEGVFPADVEFYLRYNEFYVEQVRQLDCVGLYLNDWDMPFEKAIVEFYGLHNKFIHYVDLHPDRAIPADDANCYLPAFRDKKILIVCPFAGVLAARAQQDIFQAVWSKLGKRWFFPHSVRALDIPYGFAGTTHAQYATALDLYEDMVSEIDRREFDVALIGAGGLAIPLAAHVKRQNKIALDLGGHLQMVFGVLGKKWKRLDDWRAAYYNDAWMDMPAQYRPVETDVCFDDNEPGGYW